MEGVASCGEQRRKKFDDRLATRESIVVRTSTLKDPMTTRNALLGARRKIKKGLTLISEQS